jgi:hypothetical protein
MPSPNLYRTSDIYFAAFLCSLDISLETTEDEGEGARKVIFVFKLEDVNLKRMKSLYFGGSGTVKARVFVDHLRSLKSMCYV